MKEVRHLMGMPVIIEVADDSVTLDDFNVAFDYLQYVDETFSTYKETSEISRMNAGLIEDKEQSPDMQFVLAECARTKEETNGYFNIERDGKLDPSGYVKGWAIQQAAQLFHDRGYRNYFVEIAGDIQTAGTNKGEFWRVGIRNPFAYEEIIKVVSLCGEGIATSGTAARGQHIYNPHEPSHELEEIVSLTVIGPKIVDADRFATAAFAMGREGVAFIATHPRLEAYAIDKQGTATFTPGFTRYIA